VAVPALPRNSGAAGTPSLPLAVTTKLVASGSATPTPIAVSASAMRAVSSLFSAPVRRLVPFASAASSRARLVIDFEPGRASRPLSGWEIGVSLTAWGRG
jgi:hypothetical protein